MNSNTTSSATQNLVKKSFKTLALISLILTSFTLFSAEKPKGMFKLNGAIITSKQIADDARIFLSQNLNFSQIEALKPNQLKNLTQSIMVKKFLLSQAAQDKTIKKSLKAGGALNDALNRLRIDIVSQAYLDSISKKAVTKKAIAQQYKNFKNQMKNATEYELQAVITSNKAAAKKAKEEINSGILFADVAAKYSIDPQTRKNRGNLGKVISVQLSPELQKVLKTLRVYEVSRIVEIGKNFTIVRYSAKSKPKVPKLSQMSNSIRNQLLKNAKQQYINQIAAQVKLEPIVKSAPK